MLTMALNALVHATVTLVEVVVLGDLVGTSVSHVKIVANPLLLLIPSAVSMQSSWQVRSPLPVARLALGRSFRLSCLLGGSFIIICLPLDSTTSCMW